MTGERRRASRMTGTELRYLREQAGFTIAELAGLMDCHEHTLRNLESKGEEAKIGRPMARLLTLLTYPPCKGIVPPALEHRDHILRQRQNNA